MPFNHLYTLFMLHPHEHWDPECLSWSCDITWAIIVAPHTEIDWCWKRISALNPNITKEIILQNPEKPWDRECTNARFFTSWDDILRSPPSALCLWVWLLLSRNPEVGTWEHVRDHPHFPWNWLALSMNPQVATWERVRDYPEFPWCWDALSGNPKVATWDHVWTTNPELPWDWGIYSDIVEWEHVRAHPDLNWNWGNLSGNPKVATWDRVVSEHPELPWDWEGFSMNLNVTWSMVVENPTQKWSYIGLSHNRNLTWRIVHENIDKPWSFLAFTVSTFGGRQNAAVRLQRWWRYTVPRMRHRRRMAPVCAEIQTSRSRASGGGFNANQ